MRWALGLLGAVARACYVGAAVEARRAGETEFTPARVVRLGRRDGSACAFPVAEAVCTRGRPPSADHTNRHYEHTLTHPQTA